MICPNCSAEFRDGFTRCSDCDVDLVEGEWGEAKEQQSPMVWFAAGFVAAVVLLLVGYRVYEWWKLHSTAKESARATEKPPIDWGLRELKSRPHVNWSKFVINSTGDLEPVPATNAEIAGVDSVRVGQEIDGIGARIVKDLKHRNPGLAVLLLDEIPTQGRTEASLDFAFGYRCNEAHAPDGFYVTEAVLYLPRIEGDFRMPARVIFHWTDGGRPAWKDVTCTDRGPACREQFLSADISFTKELSETLRREKESPPASPPSEKTASVEQPASVLRVGGDVKAPILIHRVEPLAQPGTRRIAGMIVLECVVTKAGTVRNIRIVKGENDPMVPNVVDAVEQWRFRPATLHDKPVDVVFNVSTRIDVK